MICGEAVVLYSVVDGLLSKDNYMSAIVVTVIQIDVTEVHFGIIAHWSILQNIMDRAEDILLPSRIIAHWSILQNIMDRAEDILLPSRVILEIIYFILYVLLSASPLFL